MSSCTGFDNILEKMLGRGERFLSLIDQSCCSQSSLNISFVPYFVNISYGQSKNKRCDSSKYDKTDIAWVLREISFYCPP
jgi:hypothetical protein